MMKITGLSHLFKWENLHNWWLTKYLFAPLYVRMLFIGYSSAFNTIVPTKLITKLRTLGLNTSLCNWILDFLTGRLQVVRVGNNMSAPLILNTGAPQGCVLSPLLYSLFTQDCMPKHDSHTIIKFADNTKVVGLITTTMRQIKEAREKGGPINPHSH